MANPARKPPAATDHSESAVDIPRRLEPVLVRMTADLGEVKADIVEIKVEQEGLANLPPTEVSSPPWQTQHASPRPAPTIPRAP